MNLLKPTSANSCPLTPLTFLERAATVYGDCTSIVFNNTTFTWAHTHRRCRQVASSLARLGIRRGDVVSVLAYNVPAMYELQFAVPMSGAVLNNLNTRLDARTISVMLRHSESKMLLVDVHLRALALEAVSRFPPGTPPPVLVLIRDLEESLSLPPTVESRVNEVDFLMSYEDLVKKGNSNFDWIRPINEWDPITLNYTSGTTSAPKGVVHSHRAIFIITVDSLMDWSVPKNPVYLWTLPMFHSNGWSFTWGMAAFGGTNICLHKFNADNIFSAVDRHKVTHMCGAPVVLNMIANSPNAKPLKNPVHFLTGGAPPPSAVVLRTESLGFIVSHGFGMTEVAGVVVSCAWKEKWNRLPVTDRASLKARQGVRTLALTEVNVLDPESGLGVKHDGLTQGEIVLKGPCLMLGYLKDPLATAMCMKDNGWLYTGDVGVIHPDGYLEIKDRSKDVIISGGENVSSVEVESVLYTNPAVHEAAVVARQDKFWGETPCAFVSLIGKANSEDIIKFCRDRLPHYMVPTKVVFMEELPKTATGKIKKFWLRDMAKNLSPPKERSRI
ncbi:putative AMP-dependent synthetase/ligase, AMP-binding enzyme domain-containing protein [Helianthus annuus]|uniref:AMP-dependent synthetase/ligase, AMP-binding enzyme domain-containing protein n=1 Tax=Helianthus annuus TaxID=4232 RepID=A0A251TXK9_HELAN|nr:probable acyl-activating enzyme 6 [Helianthus annuus]KAF5791118.1 putative AMP-dependent synthetase/ligase, AMP-binding enzyme domain-containing protein [Helianthus annuus]KAJ0542629.1 putative AMP-dependent synthetase/ligase, AMP-binding, AMP-binding enzyme domain, ANL [Helianthus annuus]